MRLASVLLLTHVCALLWLKEGTLSVPDRRVPLKMELRLSCEASNIRVGQPLTCDLFAIADPAGGPAILPRIWPPFRILAWPEIVVRFSGRDENSAPRWLPIAPAAGRGRYEIVKPLTEATLVYLMPGEAHGWRYRLNGDDWILPRKIGRHFLRAELVLRLRHRDPAGALAPGIRKLIGDRADLLPLVVPEGTWQSNEVSLLIQP